MIRATIVGSGRAQGCPTHLAQTRDPGICKPGRRFGTTEGGWQEHAADGIAGHYRPYSAHCRPARRRPCMDSYPTAYGYCGWPCEAKATTLGYTVGVVAYGHLAMRLHCFRPRSMPITLEWSLANWRQHRQWIGWQSDGEISPTLLNFLSSSTENTSFPITFSLTMKNTWNYRFKKSSVQIQFVGQQKSSISLFSFQTHEHEEKHLPNFHCLRRKTACNFKKIILGSIDS